MSGFNITELKTKKLSKENISLILQAATLGYMIVSDLKDKMKDANFDKVRYTLAKQMLGDAGQIVRPQSGAYF